MESDSDGEMEDFSGMEVPPLITQLKRILSEYPDGGQIIKELIQNAEDAGATEFKLMFDGRTINQETGSRDKAYRKFFKGPALCVFNNAIFEDSDWKGIKMIYNSVKEDDPLKVGRFGLGFKSVFHLTDYPCVLSADKLLMIDPQNHDTLKVNATLELKKLVNYKRMDLEAFFEALEGTFGVDKDILKTGRYEGTLFWFPLRDRRSKLSSNLYNEDKVMSLFKAITTESKCLLIFLKSLTSISLSKRRESGDYEDIAMSEVQNGRDVTCAREDFNRRIEQLTHRPCSDPQVCTLQMIIKDTKVCQNQTQICYHSWLVVNYFIGNNASDVFMSLILDPELPYSPYVSVAAPLPLTSRCDKIDGHVFCFLPLPREDTLLTGLPVHVNGFFALNQSRHHIKWQTEEKKVSDKSVQWNACLIEEALPIVYQIWVQEAIVISKKKQNDPPYVSAVHEAIPTKNSTRGKWSTILKPLFRNVENMPCLFSENQRKWVTIKEALFNDITYSMKTDFSRVILKTLTKMGKNYVDIPCNLVETIELFIDMKNDFLKPQVFAKFLREDEQGHYQCLTTEEKKSLLHYVLVNDDCIDVEGLELLPLASGKWETFNNNTCEKIFKCKPEQMNLFRELGDRLLMPASKLPKGLDGKFDSMCKHDDYQLKLPHPHDIEMLLLKVTETQVPDENKKHLYMSKTLDVLWLQNDVWKYIIDNKMVRMCENVPLFPILINNDWENPKLDLVPMSKSMILRKDKKAHLPDDVCWCLEALSIQIVPSFPSWINFVDVQEYVKSPTRDSVISVISELQSCNTDEQRQTIIDKFNGLEESCRAAFMKYIRNGKIEKNDDSVAFIKALRIFPGREAVDGKTEMFSINDGKKYTTCTDFPVKYPEQYLDGYEETSVFLHSLGAIKTELPDMVYSTLCSVEMSQQSKSYVKKFMEYFLLNFKIIEGNADKEMIHNIVSLARQVAFLKSDTHLKKPSDLFDPSDQTLKSLFIGENMCLESSHNKAAIKVLKMLGLKNRENITVDNIISTARMLDHMSRSKYNSQHIQKKAKAFMEILDSNPQYIQMQCEGKTLQCLLTDLECIEFKTNRLDCFPSWLPWKTHINSLCKPSEVKSSNLMILVGSVMLIAECMSPRVSKLFSWEGNISNEMLISQLGIVRKNCKSSSNVDLLVYLKTLYEWINKHRVNLNQWITEDIVWTGKQFCLPQDVILERNENDLDLVPHFHTIDRPFVYLSDLFESLGCERKQSTNVLLKALSKIVSNSKPCQSDITLSIKIIEILAKNINKIQTSKKAEIHIPLHTTENDKLFFKPLADCTYVHNPDKYVDDWDDDNGDTQRTKENFYFVHKGISANVANMLEIKSLHKRYLINTEDFVLEESGQEEDLTTRLKTLIEEGYKDGLSVPKELLQNADDAGAHHVKFLYDERQNHDAMNTLLDKGMRLCQGPSLWVYNDAKFSDDDFRNIRKLNGATKTDKVKTIGKFGLGFCSVYNLTDVPSIVSGNTIVILDPHKSHLAEALSGSSTGLKIDLSIHGNEKLLKRHRDQFKPYDNVFGCNLFCRNPNFNGTLFRLPLRTSEGADKSDIRNEPYSKKDMSELLKLLIENAGNLLLFTQNIKSVEVYHLSSFASSVQERSLIFRIDRSCSRWHNEIFSDASFNVLSMFSTKPDEFTEILNVNIDVKVFETVSNIKPALNQAASDTAASWIVSWATGTKESKELSKVTKMKKAIPLAAVAVPFDLNTKRPLEISQMGNGFFKEGRLYCFLPIISPTKLPWHLHGCFDVTSDRRQLTIYTEQDKISQNSRWNEYLLSDTAVNAFIEILLYFTSQCIDKSETYYNIWPVNPTDLVKPFVQSFVSYIVGENIHVFRGNDRWLSFNDIVVLEPDIRNDEKMGDIIYEMLTVFPPRQNVFIIDLPSSVLQMFKLYTCDINPKIVRTTETIEVFFKHISDTYWKERITKRNLILLFALSLDDLVVENILLNTKCIPCEGTTQLKRPKELVHPNAEISSMYETTDEMFPSDKLRKPEVLAKLVNLGMIDSFLPFEFLADRCKSIEKLAMRCCTCASIRIQSIFTYLSKHCNIATYNEDHVKDLRNIRWLPVLKKPTSWVFTWYSETCKLLTAHSDSCCSSHKAASSSIILGKPYDLHRSKDHVYVGAVANVLDETTFGSVSNKVWSMLGFLSVEDHHHTEKVVNQLIILSEEYNSNPEINFDHFGNLFKMIVANLHKGMDTYVENAKRVQKLCNRRVLLIDNGQLVFPRQVAVTVLEDCYPYLCKLPVSEWKLYGSFYLAVGVKEKFSVRDVIEALSEKSKTTCIAEKDDIQVFVKLLQNLVNAMEEEGQSYENYREFHMSITGPDRLGNIYPTHELVIEDDLFQTSVNLKLMHEDIPVSLGEKLGMKAKKRKCLDEISFAIPWGQTETLVARLHGLLKDYPCDSGIMKELLQNADDVDSTELHFVKDYRSHSTNKIFGEPHLQGPALCVYNDSFFSESDMQGIQNLGVGSKREDPSKTGQYGLGFNSVYHLTDTPSFLTKGPGLGQGQLCMLDPLCKNIPVGEQKPGLRSPVEKIRKNFPNMMMGYLENDGVFASEKGTLFRFPLRTTGSELNSEIMTEERINQMLDEFIKEMLNSLLFVKSVKSIKVSNITTGQLKKEYSLKVNITAKDETKRQDFFNKVKQISNDNKFDLARNLRCDSFSIDYILQTEDSYACKTKWLIVQSFGVPSGTNIQITTAFNDKQLLHLPIGGVAVPFLKIEKEIKQVDIVQSKAHISASEPGHSYIGMWKVRSGIRHDLSSLSTACHNKEPLLPRNVGKLFTCLPLPVNTGFTIHINGHFSLDHSRRDLWNAGYGHDWNAFLGSSVIIPSWIIAIQYFKRYFTNQVLQELEVCSWKKLKQMINLYHSIFPNISNAKHEYTKLLVAQFYDKIMHAEIDVFPVIRNNDRFAVTWVALKSSRQRFGAVFNNIYSYLLHLSVPDTQKMAYELEHVLKKIGMDLIASPFKIHSTLVKLGHSNVASTTPSYVLDFLKTFQDEETGTCVIPDINTDIEETNFGSKEVLNIVLRYILMTDEFSNMAEGLPVLLTKDNKLHQLSTESTVYHFLYGNLLPSSITVFVHDDFLTLLDREDLFKDGYLKRLEMTDFKCMLKKEELNSYKSQGIISWNREDNETLITPEWIRDFYNFIAYNKHSQKQLHDKHVFFENIFHFHEYSFLPAIYSHGTEVHTKLVQLAMSYCLYVKQCGNEEVTSVIDKLHLPYLDPDVLSLKEDSRLRLLVKTLLAKVNQPYELLRCLNHHRRKITYSNITIDEASSLLAYFDNHIKDMKVPETKQLLKQLPLYQTHQNTLRSLNVGDVFILPATVPIEGIAEWALRSNLILLKQTGRFPRLYDFIGIPCADIVTFYEDKLIPNITLLPRQHWLEHICYLKDSLNVEENAHLLDLLKSLPFLNIDGKMKRAKDLYWPHNEVFSLMLTVADFPPKYLCTSDWEDLFRSLETKFEVTDQMLLQFAEEIEIAGLYSVNTHVREKSDALLSCFLSGEWGDRTLERIKSIKFICPFKVAEELNQICSQPGEGSKMIAFENSVSAEFELLCWSNVSLLEKLPTDCYTTQLGIFGTPPTKEVIQHCQNVSTEISGRLEHETVEINLVKRLMDKFYSYFNDQIKNITLIAKLLESFPVVFLPLHNKMVQTKAIVLDLEDKREIRPYLYTGPEFYWPHFNLFFKMGSKRNLEIGHCIYVLQALKKDVEDNIMHPKELDIAKRAISNMLLVLKDYSAVAFGHENLYLPNRQGILKDSKLLTVSDDGFLESLLQNKISIDYFIGFDTLEIEQTDPCGMLMKLPEAIRPKLLSKVVTRQICLDQLQTVEESLRANALEEFLHSAEFITGVLRIVKHYLISNNKSFDEQRLVPLMERNMKRTKVVSVSALRYTLQYDGRSVHDSQWQIQYFLKTENVDTEMKQNTLYIQEPSSDCENTEWMNGYILGLVKLVNECTLYLIKEDAMVILLIYKLKRRSEIVFELDSLGIAPFHLVRSFQSSAFPKPGTYVEKGFHPFLEQTIIPFKKEEYGFIALELEDSGLEHNIDIYDNEPVYIYVRIIKEVLDRGNDTNLGKTYVVNTGNVQMEHEQIPIYRLYRFVRRHQDTSSSLVKFDNESVQAFPFDKTCTRVRDMLQEAWALDERQRRRIIKRLRMRWHPDRNPEHKEYAGRIFNYISSVILILEHGQQVSSIVDERTGREVPDMSQSEYHTMVLNVDRRTAVYSRAYRDNFDEYSRSSNTGRYVHASRERAPRPDIAEARRWMGQAKLDYRAATAFQTAVADVKGYNWICYTCHQACEKALRAAYYSKDANDVPGRTHSLDVLACGLGQVLVNQVSELGEKLNNYNKMRYPEHVARPGIPADLYSEADTKSALEKTNSIINTVIDEFNIQ